MTTPATWRRSTRSNKGANENCVELAQLDTGIAVRDSKHPEHGHITLSSRTFTTLVRNLRKNAQDH